MTRPAASPRPASLAERLGELGRFIVTVWPQGEISRAATFDVAAKDAAHATRMALDGYTGLVGDPDQSHLAVQATPVAEDSSSSPPTSPREGES